MCGLSAIFAKLPFQLESDISRMVSAMSHRGPDGTGIFIDEVNSSTSLALGHNRLSILDLSPDGAQPMKSSCGRYVLVLNGEVYNYREIASELDVDERPRGSFGDTAVVLAALKKWGSAALSRFNGMWALLFYDSLQGTLLVSRDRFGKKPLYFFQNESRLYFASEIKAILAVSNSKQSFNINCIVPYLTRGLLNFSDQTFFNNIFAFPAASFQIINLHDALPQEMQFTRYWLHPYEVGSMEYLPHCSYDEVRELFIDAVRLRLRSDVPVGVLLSGGLDSSAITGAISSFQSLDNISLLSVISDDSAASEETFIDCMANHVHHAVEKTNVSLAPLSLLGEVSSCSFSHDQPILGISDIAHFKMMQRAHSIGVKVLLSGQGADEQLGGYNKFFYFYLQELIRSGQYVQACKLLAQSAWNSNTLYEFRLSEARRYLSMKAFRQIDYIAPEYCDLDGVNTSYQGSYSMREWLDITSLSLPALLHFEDRNSMSVSTEVRAPFLDYRLVDLLARINPAEKFEGGWTKSIFRKAITGLVPREIQYRRDKKGFNVPEDLWMRTCYQPAMLDVFGSDMLSDSLGFLNGNKLREAYLGFVAGKGWLNGRQFMRAYALELFLRRFS